MVEGFKRFYLFSVLGIATLLLPLVAAFHARGRALLTMAGGSLLFFCCVFVVTNVYYLTYLQVGAYYVFGFAGLVVVALPLWGEIIQEKFPRVGMKHFVNGGLFLILIMGTVSALEYSSYYAHGSPARAIFLPDLQKAIPNEEGTRVFFMNNVNPLTAGFERAQIVDYTSFPHLAGDPCEFWRANRFTHIIFWRVLSTSAQLDGGNPQFYRDAKDALLANRCTRLLSTNTFSSSPLIGEVIP